MHKYIDAFIQVLAFRNRRRLQAVALDVAEKNRLQHLADEQVLSLSLSLSLSLCLSVPLSFSLSCMNVYMYACIHVCM